MGKNIVNELKLSPLEKGYLIEYNSNDYKSDDEGHGSRRPLREDYKW
ncbi:hypothetical protein [Anaeroplasma bactoclasticum]|jgi:hypothetical protein|nr:hypothetical protein [Anaeroplasma bactoclasticum]